LVKQVLNWEPVRIDASDRDGEKLICSACGYHQHGDMGAAGTILYRGWEIVPGDWGKPVDRTTKCPKKCQDKSPHCSGGKDGLSQVRTLAIGILRLKELKNFRVFLCPRLQ
jgi:hypothetical protein